MPNKKRLLVNAIPATNINTGIARYIRCLYAELEILAGDEFEIYYFDGSGISRNLPSPPKDLQSWSRSRDIFWSLPPRMAFWLRVIRQYKRQWAFQKAARGFDIYHEAGFFPFSVPDRTKTVFTIHDMSLLRFPRHHPRERVMFNKFFFYKQVRDVHAFLTVSEFSRQEIGHYLDLEGRRVTVTPLAHDRHIFHPGSKEETVDFLHKKKLPQKYFLFVGSGDPRKNMDVIPRALQRANLDIPLLVCGWSGWSNQTSTGNTIYLGYLEDRELALLYSGAMAFIFPSTYEGFGLPILEAMACGCPVVTTGEASLPEVAGDAALYLDDPRDTDQLADILKRLSSDGDLRAGLSRRARERAGLFSWRRTAEKTLRVFREHC